ncbi:MAG: polyprenyl synthetase family protein [Micrococcales bacterium]|nr:polyprenyl synthetase family protein [Micrococcales bacterium]
MLSKDQFLTRVQADLDGFCDRQSRDFEAISPDLVTVVEFTRSLLQGGKRFRALFCYYSFLSCLKGRQPNDLELDGIVGIAAALEMFHAAALVHDDLLDQSDTRRGAPAIHKRFETLHTEKSWAGSKERFGIAGSVLVGDLMLGWSSEIFGQALLSSTNKNIEAACRDEFSLMRVEVMAGQYLDVLEENAAATRTITEAVGRAEKVILYKTAKYSIEAPLRIGAAFAGADQAELGLFTQFGIPLGIAFQLRDDILGVFGDPSITGKPAGDDLREGKRTVLVALTKESLAEKSPSMITTFEELLTSRELDVKQIEFLQKLISDSGALAKTERMIVELGDRALSTLEHANLDEYGKGALIVLARKVVDRDA